MERLAKLVGAVVGIGTIGGAIATVGIWAGSRASASEIKALDVRVVRVETKIELIPEINQKVSTIAEQLNQLAWSGKMPVVAQPAKSEPSNSPHR